ncbi:hypothetical protein CBF76_01045 [Lactobacillus taiwanensis]|uniref:hypothetical protein n=1 Tax=Lactobacillus taiwanensis TaxID=508451 RepID=UPI000B97CE9C|nr:hypothetical protein [Lactobacillus taiwanensis]OYS21654.1 hypothetical protein CBF76_01045 [Lactobacillus taiwanensis]
MQAIEIVKNNKNKIIFSITIIGSIILVCLIRIDSNLKAALISALVSVLLWLVQTIVNESKDIEIKKQQNINQVKINYYILLTKINEFPSQLNEKIRFKIMDKNIENRNLDIINQFSLELNNYKKIISDVSNIFMKSWIELNDNNINAKIIKMLSDIEMHLHILATKISPEFVRDGLAETENLKEKIVDEMLAFTDEIYKYDENNLILGKNSKNDRQHLCNDIIEYQNFKNAIATIITPLFKIKNIDLTSREILDATKNEELDKITLPFSDYKRKNMLNKANGNRENVVRELMKLWGLKHDKPNNFNSSIIVDSNISKRRIYYWRDEKKNHVIHISNGIGSKQFEKIKL